MGVWDFIQDQVLGMKWLNELLGIGLSALGLDVNGRIGGSVQFFIYDVLKITVLLCVLIFAISYIQSYFPPERSKRILGRFHGIWANIISALLGTVTPFCSCSSIPLFIGFTSAGLPLGVTFSFLISSPMVDLGSLVLLMSIFGAKVAVVYVILGLVIAVIGGSMTVIVELWESCKKNTPNTLKIIISATWQLALAVILSLIGASFVAAVLGDSRFFLEIDIYKGVKLTFILPVLLISLWYMQRFNVLSKGQIGNIAVHLKNFFSTRITVKHVAFLGVLAFVAYIFVGRSGHTAGVPVPALEIKMRLFLEQMMYARPREKEFMIGHPAFYLAAFAAYKQAPRLWQMLLVVGATIGQGSLVQTFAHMRTPVIMSYIRAVDGYALGAVLGIIAVIAVSILLPYVQKWQRRFLEHE